MTGGTPVVRRLKRRLRRLVGGNPPPNDLKPKLNKAVRARDKYRQQAELLTVQARQARLSQESVMGELTQLRSLGFGDERRDRDLSYVFILACGRTGSTLLQGILNSAPGVMIRGENGGVVEQLFRYHRTVLQRRDPMIKDRTTLIPTNHPWWGIDGYPEELALREFRHLVLDTLLRPSSDTTMVGFKEVRSSPSDMPEFVDFMSKVFPGARFIHNTRNLEDVAQSGWWPEREADPLAKVTEIDARMREAVASAGDRGFEVSYDDYVKDPTALKDLFSWLDLPFSATRIRGVMSQSHSYQNRTKPAVAPARPRTPKQS
jgi:hypothetical protein